MQREQEHQLLVQKKHAENREPYSVHESKLPTNTTSLMPQALQRRGKGGGTSVTSQEPDGKCKGWLMARPHSDGFSQDMLSPMGLHNLSDVQQYRTLVEMRNQDIMDKREDQVLREYQHVTQGLTTNRARERLTQATGQARAQPPADATPEERAIHAAITRTTKRSKRELEVAGAHVAGKPYIPRRGGGGGFVVSGAEPAGARVDRVHWFRQRRNQQGKGKGKKGKGTDDDSD